MAAPQMIVRIAANIDELKRNIAEGGNVINTTATNLARMSSSLNGDALIRKAQEITASVNNIGGASRLTEAEQARVNATLEKALAKYAALGQEAPKAMRDLADQTRKVEERSGLLERALGPLKNQIVAAFSIGAVTAAVDKVLEFTGKLTDLSGKTGISTSGLQMMNLVLGQSGVSLEQASAATVKMSKNLVEGKSGTANAVAALGLNIKDLIAAGPERAFLEIGSAIASVPDPMERAALATQVFGKSGADLLPAFSVDMLRVAESAQKSGAILDEKLVAAGDNAGDALGRLKVVGLSLLANVILPMAPGIEAVANWLAGAMTAGLAAARDGVDWLLRKGLELNAWLADSLVQISEAVSKVPVMGRVFGQVAGDTASFKEMARQAHDTLDGFNMKAVQPTTKALEEGEPKMRAMARAVEDVGKQSDATAPKVREVKAAVETNNNLVSRAITDTAKLSKELETWAFRNGAVYQSVKQVNSAMQEQEPLMSRSIAAWDTFKPAVTSSLAGGEAATGSFFDRFKAAFGGGGEGGGDMKQVLGGVTSMFTQAFLGGGGALGAMKGLATQGLGALMSMIPGIGPFIQGLAGPIIEGLSKIGNKIKDFFKGLFGGPSGDELAGRELVGKFEANIQGMLTEAQKMEAGNESWKMTVIAIRDAYMAAGLTEQQALLDAERLWQSSKQGAEASKRVIAEIEANMRGAGAAAVRAVEDINRAIDDLPDSVRIPIEVEGEGPGLPGFANGSQGIRDFGPGTLAVLHGRERIQTESQMLAEQRGGGDSGGGDLVALIGRLESVLPMALRDAVLMAGAR